MHLLVNLILRILAGEEMERSRPEEAIAWLSFFSAIVLCVGIGMYMPLGFLEGADTFVSLTLLVIACSLLVIGVSHMFSVAVTIFALGSSVYLAR